MYQRDRPPQRIEGARSDGFTSLPFYGDIKAAKISGPLTQAKFCVVPFLSLSGYVLCLAATVDSIFLSTRRQSTACLSHLARNTTIAEAAASREIFSVVTVNSPATIGVLRHLQTVNHPLKKVTAIPDRNKEALLSKGRATQTRPTARERDFLLSSEKLNEMEVPGRARDEAVFDSFRFYVCCKCVRQA